METTALVRGQRPIDGSVLERSRLGLLFCLPARDFREPVIGRSLLPIAQDGLREQYAESFRSFRVAGIEIGMVRLGCLAERSPQVVGVTSGSASSNRRASSWQHTLKYRYFTTSPPAHWRFLEIISR